MKQTVIRLLIIAAIVVATIGGVKMIADRQRQSEAKFDLVDTVKQSLENTGEKVLGEVTKKLPKASELDQQEPVEPIQEPINNIQEQTNQLIEDIRNLPQDQLKAVKKQILKELCK